MVFGWLLGRKNGPRSVIPAELQRLGAPLAVQSTPATSSDVDPATIFRVGSYPQQTFINRTIPEVSQLRAALAGGGQVICISGQSKVGKTVLCQNLIGAGRLIRIPGGQVSSYEKFIGLLAGELRLGSVEVLTHDRSNERGASADVSTVVKAGGPLLSADASFALGGSIKQIDNAGGSTTIQAVLEHAVFERLSELERFLFIDHFHRIPVRVQNQIIAASKDYLVAGRFRLILASIPSRAFDVVRANSEMLGRFTHIDIPRWSTDELARIASAGFQVLGWSVKPDQIRRMAKYAYGSPLLMQAMCSNCVTLIGHNQFDPHRGLDVDRVLGILVQQYAPTFDMAVSGGQGRQWNVTSSQKPLQLGQLALLAVSEYPWNHELSILNTIVPQARKLAARDGVDIKVADIVTVLRGISQRVHASDSPVIFFEMDDSGSNLIVRDPYFRFYLQWGLRPQFGLKRKEQ